MNLQFVSRETVDRLAADVGKNLTLYKTGETYNLVNTSDCRLSRIEVPNPPTLLTDAGACMSDADCTKCIYQWLSSLSPVQAADGRLWVYLTHTIYAKYMKQRWETGLGRAENEEDVVIDRWFFKGEGARTKMHNGISRLWWFGHVMHEIGGAEAPQFIETLLSLQDIQTAILERSLGRCRPLVRAALKAITKYWDRLQQTPKRGDVIQEWAKDLRLRGGAYLLDAVPEERLTYVVERSLSERISPSS